MERIWIRNDLAEKSITFALMGWCSKVCAHSAKQSMRIMMNASHCKKFPDVPLLNCRVLYPWNYLWLIVKVWRMVTTRIPEKIVACFTSRVCEVNLESTFVEWVPSSALMLDSVIALRKHFIAYQFTKRVNRKYEQLKFGLRVVCKRWDQNRWISAMFTAIIHLWLCAKLLSYHFC